VEGDNSSMRYLIHCKNLWKCYNVPTPSTTIKKRNSLKINKKYLINKAVAEVIDKVQKYNLLFHLHLQS
jgi:hypothetical protein